MSFFSNSLTQLEHGQISDWARYTISYVKRRIGTPLSPAMGEAVVTDIEGVKATVHAAASAFLTAKLGPLGGELAGAVADSALNTIAAQLEAATRALESQSPAA